MTNVKNTYLDILNKMREAWEQHVFWTRLLIVSLTDKLSDEKETEKRLLKNPYDIASIFGRFYPANVVKEIADIITEHLQIGAQIIIAARDGKEKDVAMLEKEWYENADKWAKYFAKINPNYNYEELKAMLNTHLKLTTDEVTYRLQKNHAAEIQTFDLIEAEALQMADYFTNGLIRQC
jgi:hypothetical protein